MLFQIIDNLVHSSGRRWQALTTDYVNYNDGAGAKVHTGIVGINMFQSYYTRNSGSILTKNYALGQIFDLCFIVNLVLSPIFPENFSQILMLWP